MKIFFGKVTLLISLTVLPLALFNFIVDPLQCFRQAKWYRPMYDTNERVQSGCLARSHNYDTVIIGTSHIENLDTDYIDKVFGVKSIRLPAAGSTFYEQNKILNLAIKTGRVKNVIWALDPNILNDDPQRVRDDIVPFPYHIYTPNSFNHFLFLLDPYLIKHYAKMIVNKWNGTYHNFVDLRQLSNWEKLFVFSEGRVWQAYNAVKEGKMKAVENTNEDIDLKKISTENIDNNIFKLVAENKRHKFYIFFPPYNILRFIQLYDDDHNSLKVEWGLKKYFIEQSLGFSNMSVNDFQAVKSITHDFNSYKDLSHYSSKIDLFIINSLRKGDYKATSTSTLSAELIQKQIDEFRSSARFQPAK